MTAREPAAGADIKTDADVAADLVAMARDYAGAMNVWEQAFAREWQAHARTYEHGAPPARMAAYRERDLDIQRRHRETYRAVFARFCTPRARKYGGPDGPLSAGVPTRFAGIGPDVLGHLALARPGRAEVTFATANETGPGPAAFLFVLLKTRAGWRIDSFKFRYRSATTWTNGIL